MTTLTMRLVKGDFIVTGPTRGKRGRSCRKCRSALRPALDN